MSVSLLEYLQGGPPALEVLWNESSSTDNTSNPRYNYRDIRSVDHWKTFNLATIMAKYGNVLYAAALPPDPMPASPPRAVNSEMCLRNRFTQYLDPKVRRSLRAGFQWLRDERRINGHSVLSFGEGSQAMVYEGFTPDTAYFEENRGSRPDNRPNRAPGDLEPSWKWSTQRQYRSDKDKKEFKQVLSQVNFYMVQHHARYGFVLTDRELVAIRRLDGNGNLELSDSIRWDAQGTANHPVLTVALALWYIGMLASNNQNWFLQ